MPGPKKGTVRLTEHHKDKIRNSKVLDRLIAHAEGALPEGQEMTQSQVTAAVALLKKVMADQTDNAHSGQVDGVISFKTVYEKPPG